MWSGPSPQPSKMVGPHDHLHGALHLGISALPAAPLARVAVGPQMLLGLFYNLIATWFQVITRPGPHWSKKTNQCGRRKKPCLCDVRGFIVAHALHFADTSRLPGEAVMTKLTAKKSVKTKTSKYDVSEHLRTPEEMAAYLDAWLDEAPEDAAGIARALGDIARAKGMSQVAKDAGLSRESLYRALSAEGNPSFATVLKVAKALGVRLHAKAVPSGA